ncbi:MAG: DUF2062 domain-containing protein [Pseudomonadota bacterium]
MPKKFIKHYMPDHHRIRSHRSLRFLGTLLHDPNLFHLNRRSASGAFAVGLFFAFVPLPLQMLLAAVAAILFRVNLPVSVALVWITNPLTIPPIFYFAYLVGTWLLGSPVHVEQSAFELTYEGIKGELSIIWQPLLVGSLLLSVTSALAGYLTIRLLWRLHLVRHYRERKLRRQLREKGEE